MTENRKIEVTSTELAEALELPENADVYAVTGDETWVFRYTIPEEP